MRNLALFVAAAFAFTLAAAPAASAAQKAKRHLLANASVKSVSATSLTVTADGKDMTFGVNAKTNVVGKGIGTASRAKGGKPTVVDLLKEGDRVTVTYSEAGSTLQALRIEKQ